MASSTLTKINSGAGGPANLQPAAGAFVSIATVPAPSSGAQAYLLQIFFAALATGNQLVIRERFNGVDFDDPPQLSASATSLVEIEVDINSTDAAVPVSVRDVAPSGPSGAATWTWNLYRIEGGGGGGPRDVKIRETSQITRE